MSSYVVALDLEFSQPNQRIFSIGLAVGDIESETIVDKLELFVNINEQLSPYIKTLCHVTQEQVDSGVHPSAVVGIINSFVGKYDRAIVNPITWGCGDVEALRAQYYTPLDEWPFGRRFIDAKTLFQSYRLAQGEKTQGGLGNVCAAWGIPFRGTKHTSVDDAANTFYLWVKMAKKFAGAL